MLGGTEFGNVLLNWTAARHSPIDVNVALNPMGSVNRSGDVASVHGMVSCSRPAPVQVSVTLTQVFAGRLVATASGSADVIACVNNPQPWSAAVFNGGPIRFGPGTATADAIAHICDELGCGEAQITGTVRLKRG
jgi:hypothetical protein